MHSELRAEIIQVCANKGWTPLLAAQVMFEASGSLILSNMGPSSGIKQMDKLLEKFKQDVEDDGGTWKIH